MVIDEGRVPFDTLVSFISRLPAPSDVFPAKIQNGGTTVIVERNARHKRHDFFIGLFRGFYLTFLGSEEVKKRERVYLSKIHSSTIHVLSEEDSSIFKRKASRN